MPSPWHFAKARGAASKLPRFPRVSVAKGDMQGEFREKSRILPLRVVWDTRQNFGRLPDGT